MEDRPHLATADVEAAYRLQTDNHPAATPEVGDLGFTASLKAARRAGLARATAARSEEDYHQALTAFAKTLGDPHLGWLPSPRSASPVRRRAGAGFGVRSVDGGLWVAIEALDERARPVLDVLARDPKSLRSAARIVVDLRGNSGGDSALGDELILHLYGRSALEGVRWLHMSTCPSVGRASPGNIAYLRVAALAMAAHEPARAKILEREADRLAEANAHGRSFADELTPACLSPGKPPPPQLATDHHTVVLTDEACFSSCLILVERLKALGAVQAGRPTRSGNWYMGGALRTSALSPAFKMLVSRQCNNRREGACRAQEPVFGTTSIMLDVMVWATSKVHGRCQSRAAAGSSLPWFI